MFGKTKKGGYTSADTSLQESLSAFYASSFAGQSARISDFMRTGLVTSPPQVDVAVAEGPVPTVEEIHEAFDKESENTLAEARKLLSDSAFQRANRLSKLGFGGHPEVSRFGYDSTERGLDFDRQLYEVHSQIYLEKYGKKFITQNGVEKLIKKYGLILGEANQFIGFIPDSAIAEIEAFKLDESDIQVRNWHFIGGPQEYKDTTLRVVAPLKDFNTGGQKIVNNQLVPLDPIVLAPVVDGYLIVSKWGPEAELPEVQ